MYILGINGGLTGAYQDTSAVLVKNGKVIFAIEEERLSRVKFAPSKLPTLSIKEALKSQKITMKDISIVATHGATWNGNMDLVLQNYLQQHFNFCPQIKRFHHHDCHTASTYFASGFKESLIFTFDSSGDGVSIQISLAKGKDIRILKRYERPNSLGYFYGLFTQYIGFQKDHEEYKMMGLAAYGDRKKFDFSDLLNFKNGEFFFDTKYIHKPAPMAAAAHKDEMLFNDIFIKRMKKGRRLPDAAMSDFYKNVAASAQFQLEETVLKMIAHYVSLTKVSQVCFAGGVAMNALMNQKIMNTKFVDNLYVSPVSTDAGISLGAAWLAGLEKKIKPQPLTTMFLSNEFSENEIEEVLKKCGVGYSKVSNPCYNAAQDIYQGKIIGWFQGKMEFGPRALGNRSILANPCFATMQKEVNLRVKLRESFRPFGASILKEQLSSYFKGKNDSAPFMNLVFDVIKKRKNEIPAVVHADGSCRIQTVSKKDNPLFYQLLKEFEKLSGHGVLLNTSFNLNHEPIVYTAREAIASYFASGLDVLYINHFKITKKH